MWPDFLDNPADIQQLQSSASYTTITAFAPLFVQNVPLTSRESREIS